MFIEYLLIPGTNLSTGVILINKVDKGYILMALTFLSNTAYFESIYVLKKLSAFLFLSLHTSAFSYLKCKLKHSLNSLKVKKYIYNYKVNYRIQ